MDKIICDVCGTSYPDSAGQCPICGYVRSTQPKSAPTDDGCYTHVRGGRFSSNNVKRRNSDQPVPRSKPVEPKKNPAVKGSNLVLGITAIILLLVLVLVIVIFVSKVFGNMNSGVNDLPENTGSTVQTTEDPDVLRLCQELHTDKPALELAEEGAKHTIQVTPVPVDTTDSLSFVSVDPEIATVDAYGTVTAVSGGETAITVRCGEATLIITVNCTFGPQIPADGTWSMNRKDITFSKKGESWDLYSKNSTIPKNLIKWTSEDETIATIEDGIVKAVSSGKTKVTGECNGITYSCTIRCKLPAEETPKEEDKDQETDKDKDQEQETTAPNEEEKTVKISHTDVTLKPEGEANEKSFNLYLKDGDGNKLDVTWTASDEGYVTIEGNKITAIKAGKSVTISTTYEGQTYKCVLRLK